MSYQLFDGDDELSTFVISCHDVNGVKRVVDYYAGIGYDCSQIEFNPNAAPNVIVRPKEMLLLPCGAFMSCAMQQKGEVFKDIEDFFSDIHLKNRHDVRNS
jgi:hypothetical protein